MRAFIARAAVLLAGVIAVGIAPASAQTAPKSLPATMTLPPSLASMLAVTMNLLVSLPVLGSRTTKHFWLLRMVARITSSGIAR